MNVSIIITSYNYASYIEECVNSCLFQERSALSYEVIVVNDGSTDETPKILNGMKNPKLRIFTIENAGIEGASNFGFRHALGEYVVRVDADDKLCPDYLNSIESQLSADYGFFYSNYIVIDDRGNIIDDMALPEFCANEILLRGDFLATGTLYSAKILADFGYYNEEIKNSGLENYELILKLLNAGVSGKHIPKKLFFYRRHSQNISVKKNDQIFQNGQLLFERKRYGSYGINKYHPYGYIRELK